MKRQSGFAERTREYHEILIKPLTYVAYRCGYALAVHGSLSYDIDLVACPWREGAVKAERLAEDIRKAAEAVIGIATPTVGQPQPEQKPLGRLAWSFQLGGGPYIDLSVMPIQQQVVAVKVDEPRKRKAVRVSQQACR